MGGAHGGGAWGVGVRVLLVVSGALVLDDEASDERTRCTCLRAARSSPTRREK